MKFIVTLRVTTDGDTAADVVKTRDFIDIRDVQAINPRPILRLDFRTFLDDIYKKEPFAKLNDVMQIFNEYPDFVFAKEIDNLLETYGGNTFIEDLLLGKTHEKPL